MRFTLAALGVVLLPAALTAQANRLSFADDWRHQHKHTLAVIDSATPAMLNFRTTKGVRTFAEQIDHITGTAALIVGNAVLGKPVPRELLGDTAVYLHDIAKLREHADGIMQWVVENISAATDDQLLETKALFGGALPKWRWNLTALQHSAWTLGQTVPYLRMNGRTPPMFTPF